MTRKKASVPTEGELLDLTVAIEQQTEQLQAMRDELPALRDEIRTLRRVLDEVRDELETFFNGQAGVPSARPVMHITSMSKDPCAKDFVVNRHSARDLPDANTEQATSDATQEQDKQGTLW